ncbi:glutathione S-transferase N-terminal domain-containing protein [Bradyrhizobium sp. STM 3809]|uniref:glutathione S-transferase family protein n=1 Tax=Bradyrhizobium sp. STM 3809 TaxID=551936 RepID=UPI00024098AB|nr:glutathione S-transferase N-terminal domain-containing protein [Bradyrhizobium sp. STM 3809]CCE01893.1 putative glutathione S-transferase GSTF2 (GST-II) [Bradyrhizobium sp. STM 3809]
MSEFVVHSVPGSPFGRSVLATLEEKGAPYRLAAMAPGDSKSAAHVQRHPFGRVPALEHDGFTLYETQAILRYLDRVRPEPALTPADPRQAARMDQVMNISDWYLFQGVCNVIIFQRIVGPQFFDTACDEAAIARAMPQARTVIAELSRLLGDQPFMAGDRLSLADLQAGPQASFLSLTPEWTELTAAHPKLVAWVERLEARPSFQATTMAQLMARAQAA